MKHSKRMFGAHPTETFVEGDVVWRRCVFCGEIKHLKNDFPKNGVDADGNAAYRQEKIYKK